MRVVPIHWTELETAFERNSPDTESFMDLRSGEVVTVTQGAIDYNEQRGKVQPDQLTTSHEVGAQVLAGKWRIEDLDVHTQQGGTGYTDIFWVEDYVMQVGQGVVNDRTQERIGKGDTGIVLMRHIWERELRALAEGRPLKQWTTSAGLGVMPETAAISK